MLNDSLDWLGVPAEWRPPLYAKRPRPRYDSDLFVETDPALIALLSDTHSPNLEVWRGILRLWREVKTIRIAHSKASQDYQAGRRKTRPKARRPHYAFDIAGRRYQTHLNEEFDFEIRRHLGDGVTMVENRVRLGRMALSQVMQEALVGRALGSVVEMQGIDQAEYGAKIIDHAYSRGAHTTVLTLADCPGDTPLFNFHPIEALLEKQDRDRKRSAA